MKLTKEDYMRLPKERLADLLVERDAMEIHPNIPYVPYVPETANPQWQGTIYKIIC